MIGEILTIVWSITVSNYPVTTCTYIQMTRDLQPSMDHNRKRREISPQGWSEEVTSQVI